MPIKPPCLNCDKRKLNCHSNCDGYKEFRQACEAIKEARQKGKPAISYTASMQYKREAARQKQREREFNK